MTAQLCDKSHPQCDIPTTLSHQLYVDSNTSNPRNSFSNISSSRKFLITTSSHDRPPTLASFAELDSHPFNFYRAINFYRLHAVDLGIVRQFSDLVNTVIHKNSILPISKIMTILNKRYLAFSPQFYQPFLVNKNDSQAGL